MDHLKSSQERRDRWYARQIVPTYVPVNNAITWEDVWKNPVQGRYSEVKSVPFEWLRTTKIDGVENNVNLSLSEKLKKTLECHGFLVISGVLDPSECEEFLEQAWDWIEAASAAELAITKEKNGQTHDNGSRKATTSIPPVCRENPTTVDSIYFPRSVEGGMMPFYGSGHSQFAWTIRSHPHVKHIFEALHDEETDLLTSLDGIVLWREGNKHRTDPGWFHLDQNPRYKPGPEVIQGLVNLLPTSPATGGNVLVAQSHKLFPHHYIIDGLTGKRHPCSDFYQARLDELGDEDWMEIDPNDSFLLGDPTKVISCLIGPGDMLLWDSRTAHCSYPAAIEETDNTIATQNTKDNAANNAIAPSSTNGLIRAATVVSMMPAKEVPEKVLNARKMAVQTSRTLTHWANKVAPLGEEHPEHVQKEQACVQAMKQRSKERDIPCPLLSFDDLTEAQQALVVGKTYQAKQGSSSTD